MRQGEGRRVVGSGLGLLQRNPSSHGTLEKWCRRVSSLSGVSEQRKAAARAVGGREACWEKEVKEWECKPRERINRVNLDFVHSATENPQRRWDGRFGERGVAFQIGGVPRCGRLEDAFDVEAWSRLCEEGQLRDAVDLLEVLLQRGFNVPAYLFYHVLKGCISQRDLAAGRHVHALISKSGYESDAFLGNHIIRMYASHGMLQEALQVCDVLAAPGTFVWASIIGAHAEQGQPLQALTLYGQMRKSKVKPNDHVFVAALKACAAAADLAAGKLVHADVLESGVQPNIFVANCLMDMYAKCGSLQDARRVFDNLQTKDVVSWTTMITGYAKHGLGQEALSLYSCMEQEGITEANCVTFLAVLKACASIGALREGKDLHSRIRQRGLETDLTVSSCLVDMYSKCGSLEDARRLFDRLPAKNFVTWNAMIAGYVQHGFGQEALALYRNMQQEGIPADRVTFVCLLKACASIQAACEGEQLHMQIQERGLESDILIGSSLVDMYAKCGSLEDARRVFDMLPTRDMVTWTAMITGYAQHGRSQEALSLNAKMQQEGMFPADHVTFVSLLKACASIGALQEGQQLHTQIQERQLERDVVVGNCLVNMYAKCARLADARSLFERLPTKDAVTWNAMIGGYVEHGLGREALTLYANKQAEGLTLADPVTFVSLLKACVSVGALNEGKNLHLQIREQGFEADVVVGSCLVNMYAKLGSLGEARIVFDRLPVKNVVTWNAMIAAYAQAGLGQDALNLYQSMLQEGVTPADRVTFVCLLNACASVGSLHQGMQLHSQVQESGLEADVVVGNCLVDMYAKCGSLEDARRVFDILPTRDIVTLTAMITAYAQRGQGQEALSLYSGLRQQDLSSANITTFATLLKACASIGALQEGKELHSDIQKRQLEADPSLANCLVDMYAKCGSLEDARRVFDRVPTKDVALWNSIIAGYARNGLYQEALAVYASMKNEGITPPDSVTFTCLLSACASLGALHQGKKMHHQIQEQNLDGDLVVGNCLVDMYAKCGSLDDARKVFDRLPSKDVVTWNAMLAGYAQHGLGQDALALYESMQQASIIPADSVTFVCLLKACASIGALPQGKQLHLEIQQRGLEADVAVANSLVDMYGKCGCLMDARRVFDRLPTKNVVTWNALLNGLGQHNDSRSAILCFEEMLGQGVEPDETTFICLLVACSHAGLVDEGKQFFKAMAEEHGISPTVYHYTCMVDLLGRSGCLDEAENMLHAMPVQSDSAGWKALLNACRSHGDIERGERSFDHIRKLEPEQSAAYVLMANIYANNSRWKDVDRIETLRKSAGACKKPARAWIEVNHKVEEFVVGEQRDDISSKLRSVNLRLKEDGGHVPHTDLVLKPLSDEKKEDALCGHAEKLALAYGLLNTPDGTTLLVTKNLRMCDDCHSGTKIMSRIEKREIIVRDTHRVHRFVDGSCSCRDWH